MSASATASPPTPASPSLVVRVFRAIALAEGASYLVLVGICMPLKYVWHWEHATLYAGWAHGVLFMAYVAGMFPLFLREGWPLARAPFVFVAALLPFGTFVLERKWLRSGVTPGASAASTGRRRPRTPAGSRRPRNPSSLRP